jgi:hypothetical protein
VTTDELITFIESGKVGNNRWKLVPCIVDSDINMIIRTDDEDNMCPVCAAARDLIGHRWPNSEYYSAANDVKLDKKHAVVDAADNTGPYIDHGLRQRLLIACGLANREDDNSN